MYFKNNWHHQEPFLYTLNDSNSDSWIQDSGDSSNFDLKHDIMHSQKCSNVFTNKYLSNTTLYVKTDPAITITHRKKLYKLQLQIVKIQISVLCHTW
jgi:hypothetical protein